MTRLAALPVFLALGAALSFTSAASARERATADLENAEKLVFEETNAFRAQQERRDLLADKLVAATAQRFADYMARNDKYGHDVDGRTPGQRLRAQGYAYCMVAENIAYAYDSRGFHAPELVRWFMEGWKASSGHRRNLLDPDATVTGIAIARSPRTGYYYAVQMFARPMKAARCR